MSETILASYSREDQRDNKTGIAFNTAVGTGTTFTATTMTFPLLENMIIKYGKSPKTIQIKEIRLRNSFWRINETNNRWRFTDANGQHTLSIGINVSIPNDANRTLLKTYTLNNLMDRVMTQMNAVGSQVYSYVINPPVNAISRETVTINAASNFTLDLNGLEFSLASILGFSNLNFLGSNSYTSDLEGGSWIKPPMFTTITCPVAYGIDEGVYSYTYNHDLTIPPETLYRNWQPIAYIPTGAFNIGEYIKYRPPNVKSLIIDTEAQNLGVLILSFSLADTVGNPKFMDPWFWNLIAEWGFVSRDKKLLTPISQV